MHGAMDYGSWFICTLLWGWVYLFDCFDASWILVKHCSYSYLLLVDPVFYVECLSVCLGLIISST